MTNEQLAITIQGGDISSLPLLWEQTKLFIYRAASRYFNRMTAPCTAAGVTVEDLQQTGYLALCDAVRAYDGRFGLLAYLKYPLLNHYNALVGLRQRQPEPLNLAGSLSEPVPGAEDVTIADTVPDPAAEAAFTSLEEQLFLADLRRELDAAIGTLADGEQAVIRGKHLHGLSIADIAGDMGIPHGDCKALEQKALRRLRHPDICDRLKPYRDEIIGRYAYRGSLAEFKHTHTSSTEKAVLKLAGL